MNLRLHEEELTILRSAAEGRGLTISALVRQSLADAGVPLPERTRQQAPAARPPKP